MREKLTVFPHGQYVLESTFHWLSEDTVMFEVNVGVCEKFAEM